MSDPTRFDTHAWPQRLKARTVTPDGSRFHGYEIGELIKYRSIAAISYLSVLGELPDRKQERGFEVAFGALMTIAPGTAASHAAVLAQLSGAHPGATMAVAVLALGQVATQELDELWDDIARFLQGTNVSHAGDDPPGRDAIRVALGDTADTFRSWRQQVSQRAAAILLLSEIGFSTRVAIERVLCMSGSLSVFAEAFAAPHGEHAKDYPFNLPEVQY